MKRLEEITKGVELTFGCKVDYNFIKGYDIVINHPETTEDLRKSISKLGYDFGKGTFGLAGEDFCYFGQLKPSTLFLVSSAPEGSVLDDGKKVLKPHHSPVFTFDERALL